MAFAAFPDPVFGPPPRFLWQRPAPCPILRVQSGGVQGASRVGPAQFRSPAGQERTVSLLAVSFVHPDFGADPAKIEAWSARLASGIEEVLLDGVSAANLMEGQYLVQEAKRQEHIGPAMRALLPARCAIVLPLMRYTSYHENYH